MHIRFDCGSRGSTATHPAFDAVVDSLAIRLKVADHREQWIGQSIVGNVLQHSTESYLKPM